MNLNRTTAVILIGFFCEGMQAQEPLLRAPSPARSTSSTVRPLTNEPAPAAVSDETANSARATAASLLLEIVKEFEDEPAEATPNRTEMLEEVAKIVQRKLNDRPIATTAAAQLPLAPGSLPSELPLGQTNAVVTANKPVVPNQLPAATPAVGTRQGNMPQGSNSPVKSYVQPASSATIVNSPPAATASIESRLKRLEQEVSELKRLLLNQAGNPLP